MSDGKEYEANKH